MLGVLLRVTESVFSLQKAICFQLKLNLASARPIKESGLELHSQRASSTDGKHTERTNSYNTQDCVGGLTLQAHSRPRVSHKENYAEMDTFCKHYN